MKYYLAIDIGASSGRGIVGWNENGRLKTEEVYRFHNGVKDEHGQLVWDIDALEKEVKRTVRKAKKRYPVCSMSIDTWGVDYVLMKGGEVIRPVYAYRDSRTERIIGEVHSKIPFEELYSHTGCQFQPFNTVYQLYDDLKQGRLEQADGFLMIPEYLMYRLTGVRKKEFTNATTTGLVNHETLQYDSEIVRRLGLPERMFPELSQPGTVLGEYEGVRVVLCATHDTGSAVEGIDMEGRQLYLSSGTWSLLGVKTEHPLTDPESREANYSNEGGVGYNRYQKNIMGMWLVNRLHAELCPGLDIREAVKMAENSRFDETIDVNDRSLLSPPSMKEAFEALTGNKDLETGDYFRCACRSLALGYRKAIEQLEKNTGCRYDSLYIVGGGAKNGFLNELTRQYTEKKVIALPIEATAIGNLKIQMKTGGEYHE